MTSQEKLSILVRDFRKLDETKKDHIRGLTRILADIHSGKFSVSGTGLGDIAYQKSNISIPQTLRAIDAEKGIILSRALENF